MTPLRPELRPALKIAHRELTDDIIDEYEKLTAMRCATGERNVNESTAEIDRKPEELLKSRLPNYAQVAQAVAALRKADSRHRHALHR